MKRFKQFNETKNSYDDEWGNENEDKIAEKKKFQKIKSKRKKKESEKFSAFDE
tara:strand:+ start:18 stop:176 length:159 start_codon:yes stop_codon:yes gene_type:complete